MNWLDFLFWCICGFLVSFSYMLMFCWGVAWALKYQINATRGCEEQSSLKYWELEFETKQGE